MTNEPSSPPIFELSHSYGLGLCFHQTTVLVFMHMYLIPLSRFESNVGEIRSLSVKFSPKKG